MRNVTKSITCWGQGKIFEYIFFVKKFINLIKICSNWQYAGIGSNNDMASNRQQPLSEPVVALFTGAYMCHSALMR